MAWWCKGGYGKITGRRRFTIANKTATISSSWRPCLPLIIFSISSSICLAWFLYPPFFEAQILSPLSSKCFFWSLSRSSSRTLPSTPLHEQWYSLGWEVLSFLGYIGMCAQKFSSLSCSSRNWRRIFRHVRTLLHYLQIARAMYFIALQF